MKKIINRLTNIGISSEMTTEQKGLLILSNKMAWSASLYCAVLVIIALFLSENITALYDLTLVIVIFIPIVMNYYKMHTAAKLMLIFSAIYAVIAGSLVYGYDSVFKYLIILPISITFIFFSEERKWKVFLPISFIILSIVFFEIDKFLNHNYIDKSFNNGFSEEHYTGHVFESLTFMLLIAIYILMQSYYRSILKKKESELLIYKKIFDNSNEGLSIIDTKGSYVKQNNAHEEILGFTDKELLNKTPAIHMGKELYNEIEETLEKTGEYTGEFISKTKFGEKHIDLMASVIIENNKVQCIVGIQRDITKQRKLKIALENSEKRYRTLVNLMGEGLGIVDLNERFIFANPQMEKIFEVEQGTLISRNLIDFLNPEQLNVLQKQSITSKEKAINTYKLIINNDCEQLKYVQVTTAPFIDNNKRNGTIAVVVDITEREKILKALTDSEENLKIANAAKDKFFSIIGHDLRSPFNALIGFSSLMNKNDTQLEEMKKYAKLINETSVSTFRLLDNLLDWARIQTNNLVPKIQNTDLSELVNNSYLSVKNQAIEKDIKITSQLEPDIYVDVDKNMIETVVRNLTSNAIKYCNSGDTISILLKKTNREALISVKDTGVGINKDVLPKLFKTGHSISTKGTNNETGTGLGLILCKEFVERNKGKISVESTEGEGAMFSISFSLSSCKLPENSMT